MTQATVVHRDLTSPMHSIHGLSSGLPYVQASVYMANCIIVCLRGPKFQKLLKRHQAENVLQKYEPFIVQSKNFP